MPKGDGGEAAFQRQVIRLAAALGYRHYHQHYAVGSDTGWPDLVLVNPVKGRMVIAELKTDKGQLTPAQREWLQALSKVEGIQVDVWRPADMERIKMVLSSDIVTVRRTE